MAGSGFALPARRPGQSLEGVKIASQVGRALWLSAAVGAAFLFAGTILDLTNLALVGGVMLAAPMAVALIRLFIKPPEVMEATDLAMEALLEDQDPSQKPYLEAKRTLRDTGEERRPS